jgi:hypothetical protein
LTKIKELKNKFTSISQSILMFNVTSTYFLVSSLGFSSSNFAARTNHPQPLARQESW